MGKNLRAFHKYLTVSDICPRGLAPAISKEGWVGTFCLMENTRETDFTWQRSFSELQKVAD